MQMPPTPFSSTLMKAGALQSETSNWNEAVNTIQISTQRIISITKIISIPFI